MAEVDSSKDKAKPDLSGLAIIEPTSEFKWMVQLITFSLFLDSALIVDKSKNVLTFSWGQTAWSSEIGPIITSFAIFSLTMSAAIPLIEIVVVWIVFQINILLIPYVRSEDKYRDSYGYVSTWELRRLADEEKCSYLLAKSKEAEQRSEKSVEDAQRTGSIVFKFLCILTLNLYVSSVENPSTIDILKHGVNTDNYIAGLFICYMVFGWFCVKTWMMDRYPRVQVFYEPLYRKKQNERAQREGKTKIYHS